MHWAAPAAQFIQENEMQYHNIEFDGIDHSAIPILPMLLSAMQNMMMASH